VERKPGLQPEPVIGTRGLDEVHGSTVALQDNRERRAAIAAVFAFSQFKVLAGYR